MKFGRWLGTLERKMKGRREVRMRREERTRRVEVRARAGGRRRESLGSLRAADSFLNSKSQRRLHTSCFSDAVDVASSS